ncbi:predicted protein [Nematostella vectensis]|uniref:Uncharacterized protein n=1 Tax=Nematostella vectensis TaxID=45351 RepID=A7SDP1_NEMVE|nr:predicted protein [Nematostella vectensis]|eukprot:XP_001630207.1 predicted protein [Nematostella vectensis]
MKAANQIHRAQHVISRYTSVFIDGSFYSCVYINLQPGLVLHEILIYFELFM